MSYCIFCTWNSAQCYVQPGWEGSLGENGYMYVIAWVPLLFTWNDHNIVNQLYTNTKFKKNNKGFSLSPPGSGVWITFPA